MKFSILTATYNALPGLREAIAQVRAQQGEFEIEHLIIDGGSTDGTAEWLCGEVERRTSNVEHSTSKCDLKWISEPDKGLYDALNKGLRMATGDVIGILHTDDVWEPGTLKRVCDAFCKALECGPDEGGAALNAGESGASLAAGASLGQAQAQDRTPGASIGAVYGDLLYVDAQDISKVRRVWKSGSYDRKKWFNGWMPPHPALFVTRELAQRAGEYRLDLGSAADYEWMLRAGLVHDAKFVYINDLEEQKQKGSAREFLTFSPSEAGSRENVKNHGLTPFAFAFVRMRVGGQSNVSVKGRLKAHDADRKAWELNGLKPRPWTLKMKLIRKIPQWVRAWGLVFTPESRF